MKWILLQVEAAAGGGGGKSGRAELGYDRGVGAGSTGYLAEVVGAVEGAEMRMMPALVSPPVSSKQKRDNEAKVKAAYERKGPMTVSYQSWKRGLHPMQIDAIISGLSWETMQPASVAPPPSRQFAEGELGLVIDSITDLIG